MLFFVVEISNVQNWYSSGGNGNRGGQTDFYSGRLTKKEWKCSLADEILADSSVTAYRLLF